jgi:hypothetical protein
LWMSMDDVSHSWKGTSTIFKMNFLSVTASLISFLRQWYWHPRATLHCYDFYITTGFAIVGELDNASVDWKYRRENTVDWHVGAGTVRFPAFPIFEPSQFEEFTQSKFSWLAYLYLLIDSYFAPWRWSVVHVEVLLHNKLGLHLMSSAVLFILQFLSYYCTLINVC